MMFSLWEKILMKINMWSASKLDHIFLWDEEEDEDDADWLCPKCQKELDDEC